MAKFVLKPCGCQFFTDVRPDPLPRYLDEAKVYISDPGPGTPISRTLYGDPSFTVDCANADDAGLAIRAWHDADVSRCLRPKVEA